MKNYIKKINTIGIILLFIFTPISIQWSEASTSYIWNGYSNDCLGLTITNVETGEGYGSPCWTGTSVSGEPGDMVNLRVYYHNTGDSTNNNTHITLTAPTSSSSNKTFYARILSDQGNSSLNSVNLNLSSDQTLTFHSVKWYTENTREVLTPLLNGQDGSEILTSSGLYIGNIASGWATQGSLVVAFKISNTVTPTPTCSIKSFSASPTVITRGESTRIYWDTENCNSVSVYPSIGSVSSYGSQAVSPTSPTTYTITADGKTQTATVTVKDPLTCSIKSFSASPTVITRGESTRIYWDTENCNSVSVYPSIGSVSSYGSQAVSPTSPTTYTITADGKTQTATITVNDPQTPIMSGSITASPSSCKINQGNSTCQSTLSWNTTNPKGTSAITNNGNTIASGNNGSKTINLNPGIKTYYLYNSGELLDQTTVSASCATGTEWDGSICVAPIVYSCAINNFSASPSSITQGNSSTISWNTSNCNSVTIYPNIGTVSSSGSRSVYPSFSTTYTLTADGKQSTVVVSVTEKPINNCSINSFTVDGQTSKTIEQGDSINMAWSSSGCDYVNISNLGNNLPTSSNRTIYPSQTTSYKIIGYGTNGNSSSRTVNVNVNEEEDNVTYDCNITNFKINGKTSSLTIDEGDSVKIEWDTDYCSTVDISGVGYNLASSGSKKLYPSNDTKYTIKAYGKYGSSDSRSIKVYVDEENYNYDDEEYCVIEDFSVSDKNITSGERTTLGWDTTNCTSVKISNIGSVSDSGSRNISPRDTTTYVLSAYSSNTGTKTRSLTVNVDSYNKIEPPVYYNSCAVTSVATYVSDNVAVLNGLVTGTSGGNAYFEYGTTTNMGYRTSARYTEGGRNFSEYISGLSPNTTYYFRIVADCQNGYSQGSTGSFKTTKTQTNTNTNNTNTITRIIERTTNTNIESPVMLKIENRYKEISVQDIIDYTVTYKNISKNTLRDAVLQVVAPKGIVITNSSDGTYSTDTNTLTVLIGDLEKGEEGNVYLRGRVDSIPDNMAQVVTTAILVYTDTNDSQDNAIAYVINDPMMGTVLGANTESCQAEEKSGLAASAFWSGLGLDKMNLIDWLIIIILILVAALIARSIYSRATPRYVYKETPHA